jgi:metal-sulfur cluster biosynthetic enzyme
MKDADPRVQALWNALTTVIDPELGLDVVTLGLVYGAEVRGAVASVTYTLTTPGCPMEQIINDGIRGAALGVDGIKRVDTRIVWEPAWHSGMIAPDAWEAQ